jgi:hypothetical protein
MRITRRYAKPATVLERSRLPATRNPLSAKNAGRMPTVISRISGIAHTALDADLP